MHGIDEIVSYTAFTTIAFKAHFMQQLDAKLIIRTAVIAIVLIAQSHSVRADVTANVKLTPWRQFKFDPPGPRWRLLSRHYADPGVHRGDSCLVPAGT